MDQMRQIRVLIPPIICILTLLVGAWMDEHNALRTLLAAAMNQGNPAFSGLLGLLSAGGAVVLAGGVVIGAITNLLLRVFSWVANLLVAGTVFTYWETYLPREFFERVWKKLAPSHGLHTPDPRFYFYAAATFDHENLQKHAGDVHQWLTRRWNGFYVNANSAVGLGIALVLAVPLHIGESRLWLLGVGLLTVILMLNAVWAWRDTMEMLEFHSYRP